MRASSGELILAWLRERYPLRTFAPLAVLLAAASVATSDGSTTGFSAVAWSAALALLLVLAFRLWDDLEDVPSDRIEHPRRVLPNAASRAPFVALLGVASAGAAAGVFARPAAMPRLATAVAGCAALFLWYRYRAVVGADASVNAHVVLLKYPLIAWLVTPGGHDREWTAVLAPLALVYLALCVHEALHDPRIRRAPRVRRVIAIESALLCLVAVHALLVLAKPFVFAELTRGTAP